MTTSKSPTPQGISALLKRAGFERAVVTNNSRYHKECTEGFRVRKYPGAVLVTHWTATVPLGTRTEAVAQTERRRERVMLEQYAQVIDAAGFATEVTALQSLIVTAGKPAEPVPPHPEEETGKP